MWIRLRKLKIDVENMSIMDILREENDSWRLKRECYRKEV